LHFEKKIGLDYEVIAARLRAEITDEDRKRWIPSTIDTAAVVAWANESSAIAERPDVQYCNQKGDACWYSADQQQYRGGPKKVVAVDGAYLAAQASVVRDRLKMAGIRLGAILNVALTPG
jgi:S1/P1 Nuclease